MVRDMTRVGCVPEDEMTLRSGEHSAVMAVIAAAKGRTSCYGEAKKRFTAGDFLHCYLIHPWPTSFRKAAEGTRKGDPFCKVVHTGIDMLGDVMAQERQSTTYSAPPFAQCHSKPKTARWLPWRPSLDLEDRHRTRKGKRTKNG